MFTKCLKSLPAETSWNSLKAILRQQFSLVLTLAHVPTQLMHMCQQKGQSMQEFFHIVSLSRPLQTMNPHISEIH